MAIYSSTGEPLNVVYDSSGLPLSVAYDSDSRIIFDATETDIPAPYGDLYASETILLPDLYETGKGFTCTGLAYDGDYYYIGDIGTLSPSGTNYHSQIVVTDDFLSVDDTIDIKAIYPNSGGIQGVCIDSSDDTIWVCDPSQGLLYHVTKAGLAIESISVTRPTGIAYSSSDDTLWILNYDNNILHIEKDGTILATYAFIYSDTLDQCFLDEGRGLLYITAGTNYTGRNNIYCFNTNTYEQYIACTVDSYSVEGIWLGDTDKMIILNDGYYHSAAVDPYNQANIYDLSN